MSIYFIQEENDGLVKIGYSKTWHMVRLEAWSNGNTFSEEMMGDKK